MRWAVASASGGFREVIGAESLIRETSWGGESVEGRVEAPCP